ncbi:MAG: putative acetolactate synthase small subunit [Alphaproteobacteria bacterium ADurb.Bin438]|nr:MAG: putative acetolactate synthase small subunit [Alphaproteobacteria bacterium ADurb.Bin438]
MEIKSHTISILVDNEAGVLGRVVGLFSGRGYNIENLTVAVIDKEKGLSRITISTTGTDIIVEQIVAQIERIVPVHRVLNMTVNPPSVEREIALIKIICEPRLRNDALQIANAFRADTVDITNESCVFQVVGKPSKIDTFVELMKPLGLAEIDRSGLVALSRGTKVI